MADKIYNVDAVAVRIKEQDSVSMWDSFIKDFRPYGNMVVYQNHFLSWVPDEWTITEVQGAGTTSQNLLDFRNGVLRLTSGTNENDGSNLQLGGTADGETVGEVFAPAAGKNLYFECRVRTADVTQHDFFLGFHVEDTTIIAARGTDYIGFRTDDGDANLDVECAASSTASDSTAVHTLVNDTWVKLGFVVKGTGSIEFWVDDVLTSTLTTNIPTALMKLSLCHLTGEGNANSLDIDYVIAAQDF